MKINTVGIIVNIQKADGPALAACLIRRIEAAGRRPVVPEKAAAAVGRTDLGMREAEIAHTADILLALGGDGTLLYTNRLLGDRETPILGINIGSLGFLTEVPAEKAEVALAEVLAGKFSLEERMMLQVEVLREGARVESHRALNDIVVTKGALARVLDLETYVDGEYLTSYAADGLIIATPTGSTAYSLSAGGPIVAPDAGAIILTPICPHTLTNRPIILRDTSEVTVRMPRRSAHMMLTVDGQIGSALTTHDRIRVVRAEKRARLIIWTGLSYFTVLRKKLNWSGRAPTDAIATDGSPP